MLHNPNVSLEGRQLAHFSTLHLNFLSYWVFLNYTTTDQKIRHHFNFYCYLNWKHWISYIWFNNTNYWKRLLNIPICISNDSNSWQKLNWLLTWHLKKHSSPECGSWDQVWVCGRRQRRKRRRRRRRSKRASSHSSFVWLFHFKVKQNFGAEPLAHYPREKRWNLLRNIFVCICIL